VPPPPDPPAAPGAGATSATDAPALPAPAPSDAEAPCAAGPSQGAAPAGLWVQLGAFRAREGATSFQRRVCVELPWLAPSLAVFNDASVFRLQAGPYASREQVQAVAERVRADLQLVPMIVERR
jgi:rare lipoprotein A